MGSRRASGNSDQDGRKLTEMKVLMLMFFALFSVLVSEPLIAQEQSAVGSSTVRVEDLLTSPVGANWTSYNGDYTGRRHSALREINTSNVAQLRAAWVFHPGNSQNLEASVVTYNLRRANLGGHG